MDLRGQNEKLGHQHIFENTRGIRWVWAILIGGWLATSILATAAFPSEGFEGTSFPPLGWTNSGSAATLWSRSIGVSGYGVGLASARANFYNVGSGTGVLESATFDVSMEGEQLAFDFAYATYGGEVDRLLVYGSTDQGASYSLLMEMAGGTTGILNTAGAQMSQFVPTATDWKSQQIPLPLGVNRVRFDAVTAYGNNLYLDNVQIFDGSDVVDLVLDLSDAPDPVAVGSHLTYSVVVSNAGLIMAENVWLTNVCPSGVHIVSLEASSGTWTTNGNQLVGQLGTLASGETARMNIVVQPQAKGMITNAAAVSTSSADWQTANNSKMATTWVDTEGGYLFFGSDSYALDEDRGSVTLSVARTGSVVGEITVDYETVDGAAIHGSDYSARSGTLILSNGATSSSVTIPILNDEMDEDAESFFVQLSYPGGGAMLGAVSNTTILIRDEDGIAAIPFEEGFESGGFSNYWSTYSTGVVGPKITATNGPNSGTWHVNMNGDTMLYSLNELVLSVDLSGQEGVYLRFWHKRFPYESDNAMSDSFKGHSYADGVAISVDGSNWFKAHGLALADTGTNEYRSFDLALDPILAAQGLSFNHHVRIKFQMVGYYYPPGYGRFFDDISLYTQSGRLRFAAPSWEVAEGAGAITVTVERVQGDSGEVSVDYATLSGTAAEESDYEAATGTLVFTNGNRMQSFVVPVIQDADDEPMETFAVQLSNPLGGASLISPTQAIVTVIDDDGPGELAFAAMQYTEAENSGLASIALIRRYGRSGDVSVRWRTQTGTATPGADYVESTGTVIFVDGQVESVCEVPLLDDTLMEGPETLQLFLYEPDGGATLGLPTNAWLNLQDDEAPRAAFPFYEGFESGVWPTYWAVRSSGAGRIALTNWTTGFEGTRSLSMDSVSGDALNEATLTVDLAGQTSVMFRCWTRDYSDGAHPMPEFFSDSTNADGIAVSADGLTWHRLVDLAALGNQSVYTNLVVDLTSFATQKGLPLTSTFQVRFQQFDSGLYPSRGRSFDHISLTPEPSTTSTVVRAQGFEGETGDTWGYRIVPSLGQIALRSDRKAGGVRSLRFAGSSSQNVDSYVEFDNVSIGSHNHIRLSVAFSASQVDSADDLYLDISYNNGLTWSGAGSIKLVDGYSNAEVPFGGTSVNNPTTVSNNPWIVEIPAGQSQLKVRLRMDEASGKNNTSDFYFIDDVTLSYLPTNQPPVLVPIPDQTAFVSNRLEFAVVATDIDQNVVALSASNLPPGAVFEPQTGQAPLIHFFDFTPEESQGDATFPVIFHVSDVDGYNAQTVTIRVLDRVVTFSTHRLFAEEGGDDVLIGIQLSRPADATVPLSIDGLATAEEDYSLSSTSLTFTVDGEIEQFVVFTPRADDLSEGPENIHLTAASHPGIISGDGGCELFLRDEDSVTLATANLTSGGSAIYEGPGQRILDSLTADVVAIQEFKVTDVGGHRAFVDRTFGTNYFYCVEPTGNLPNGVISRWPIREWGEWEDPQVGDRDFVWATVDVPGGRPLHVVCVHLHSSGGSSSRFYEATLLTNYIEQAGFHPSDYVVLCGDLNIENRSEAALQTLITLFSDDHKPADQNGDMDSNQPRNKPFDVVLPVALLDAAHQSVNFGGLTFPDGLIFDTRLWSSASIPYPARVSDSAALSMQHMAVVKRFGMDRFVTLLARAGEKGFVTPASCEVGLGSNQAFTVTAEPYCHISRVTANGVVWTSSDQPSDLVWVWSNVQANAWLDVSFADNVTAPHGVPEHWLVSYGITNDFDTADEEDPDHDGIPTWKEYVMDTHPGSSNDCLQVDFMEMVRGSDDGVLGYIIGWSASTGRVYDVQYQDNLLNNIWLPMDGLTNLVPTQPIVSVTNLFHDGPMRILRLQVRSP